MKTITFTVFFSLFLSSPLLAGNHADGCSDCREKRVKNGLDQLTQNLAKTSRSIASTTRPSHIRPSKKTNCATKKLKRMLSTSRGRLKFSENYLHPACITLGSMPNGRSRFKTVLKGVFALLQNHNLIKKNCYSLRDPTIFKNLICRYRYRSKKTKRMRTGNAHMVYLAVKKRDHIAANRLCKYFLVNPYMKDRWKKSPVFRVQRKYNRAKRKLDRIVERHGKNPRYARRISYLKDQLHEWKRGYSALKRCYGAKEFRRPRTTISMR